QAWLTASWPDGTSASSDAEKVDSPKKAIPLNRATCPNRLRSNTTFDPIPIGFLKPNVDPAYGSCLLWVKSRPSRCNRVCPLYPRNRTCAVQLGMSAKGQKRTFGRLSDHVAGADEHSGRTRRHR